MLVFRSMEDIFNMDHTGLWIKEMTSRGIKMSLAPGRGKGGFEYIGEQEHFVWSNADCTYAQDYVCCSNIGERYIEIGDNSNGGEHMVTHYQTRDTPFPVEPGLNCFVNFTRWNYFSRVSAGVRLNVSSLLIRETFFEAYGIALPEDFWELTPQILNPDVLYIPEVSAALGQIKNRLDMESTASLVYLKAKAIEVAALLIDYVYSRRETAVTALTPALKAKITAARQILDQNLLRPPMVNHLGELVGLNKNALQRGFRVCTGHSVGEYLRARRMEKALDLLRSTDMAVAEIAQASGYQSPANFYNAFEKTFSTRPGEMRMLMREDLQ